MKSCQQCRKAKYTNIHIHHHPYTPPSIYTTISIPTVIGFPGLGYSTGVSKLRFCLGWDSHHKVALMLGLVVFIMAIVLKILVGNECDNPAFQGSFIYHFGGNLTPGPKSLQAFASAADLSDSYLSIFHRC